jgi:hypothetical protein
MFEGLHHDLNLHYHSRLRRRQPENAEIRTALPSQICERIRAAVALQFTQLADSTPFDVPIFSGDSWKGILAVA